MGKRKGLLAEAWPPEAKKPYGTPKANRWKITTAGGQKRIVRGHKPVVGGYLVLAATLPPIKFLIKEVNEVD